MNIRMKVISLLALLFVALIGIEIGVQRQILMPSFAELEREDAAVAMKRIEYALDSSLDSLELTTADWGNWQDVYRYVQAPSPSFVRANVTPIAMKQLQVNLLMIVDLNGAVVLSSAQDLKTGAPLDLDFGAAAALPADFPWRRNLAGGKPAKGLLRTSRGAMLIAAAPVLDGSGGGRPLGFVLMGQLLGAAQLHALGARAQVALSMLPSAPGAGAAAQGAQAARGAGQITETDDVTRVDRAFRDVYGKPLLTLRVEVPRRITARGRNAVTYASAYLVGAAIAALVVLLVALNRVVLEPLARVTRHAEAIGRGSELSARLELASRDEIGRLAQEFDGMVSRVEQSRRELVDRSFQAGFAELAKGVLHNLGNAMTPLAVRVAKLKDRLREAPAHDLQMACAELRDATPGSERYRDLKEFVYLGCRESAAALEESRADLEVIQRQATIVQTALNELMQSTRNEHVIETVRLQELVAQTLEIVPDSCRQRLLVDADESLKRIGAVRVARTVLRLVLQNLIINAADAVRDAGRDRGVLCVGAEIVREDDCEQLHLHCKDDGVGIARDDLERVFDRGFSTKSKDTNYGIGLHWCANAIAALGGRIWAASEGPGLGASLHLMVPLVVRQT
ncbi:MAG TPA: CHASE4 domain-containing protein [Steroidobacteraceae bacterium]|nr:CHASE4 domain-containing protein [Steroidobacteraceae bacterium]